jgi:hypothetical protein
MDNNDTAQSLASVALSLRLSADDVTRKTRGIYEETLRSSPHVRTGNFTSIGPSDLAHVFGLYDADFYSGALRRTLRERNDGLTFRVAPRMTRAGGKTFCTRRHVSQGGKIVLRTDYEVAISSTLLFQSFGDVERPVSINGFPCVDRLEALQRVMEHEIMHLVELLVWGKSSCAGDNFKALVRNTFAHTEVKHNLVTQRERALTKFNLRVGDLATFVYEGVRHTGRINRITRRATILVEDPRGTVYSDGRRYLKFYVPLGALQPA